MRRPPSRDDRAEAKGKHGGEFRRGSMTEQATAEPDDDLDPPHQTALPAAEVYDVAIVHSRL